MNLPQTVFLLFGTTMFLGVLAGLTHRIISGVLEFFVQSGTGARRIIAAVSNFTAIAAFLMTLLFPGANPWLGGLTVAVIAGLIGGAEFKSSDNARRRMLLIVFLALLSGLIAGIALIAFPNFLSTVGVFLFDVFPIQSS